MITTSVEFFIDNIENYFHFASSGEEVEILAKKDSGLKTLQLKLKDYNDDTDSISSTDVKEVVHANWIKNEFESLIPYEEDENGNPVMHKYTNYKCSICGRTEKEKEPYCNCGAKMDLE